MAAVPGGRRGGPSWLAQLAVWAAAGITGFVVIALFKAHGQAHDFAEGAVAAGAGAAAAGTLLKLLVRVPWADLIGLAALATLWDDLTGRRR